MRDLQIDRHSIAEFYRRRVIRIFPALFATLAATVSFALLWMPRADLLHYARSLFATAVFGSNFLFNSESGYFADDAHSKPLLHTWSLAIEEQFYIVWPLLIALVGVRSRVRLKSTVLAVILISFIMSAVLVSHFPTSTFFLLPSRAWELGLGALLAILSPRMNSRGLREVLAIIGLMMIFYAVKRYGSHTPFPGPAALLPCVGAALLIATGSEGTLISQTMSIWPILLIGRASYSIYLWHWPVIVFATIGLLLPQSVPVQLAEISLAILLGILSWRYIETPFRTRAQEWRTRTVLMAGGGAMLVTLAVACALIVTDGLPDRWSARQQRIAAWADPSRGDGFRRGTCFIVTNDQTFKPSICLARSRPEKPAILLVGDSHAAHLWPGLSTQAGRYDVLQATHVGCWPWVDSAKNECARFENEMLLQTGPHIHPVATLLAARWGDIDTAKLKATLTNPTVRTLNPILIGPVPQYATELPRILALTRQRDLASTLHRELSPKVFQTDKDLRLLAQQSGTPYISLLDAMCGADRRCVAWATFDVPMAFDYGHLTADGSRAIIRKIMPQVDRIAMRRH